MKICKDGRYCSWKPACRFLHPEGGNQDRYHYRTYPNLKPEQPNFKPEHPNFKPEHPNFNPELHNFKPNRPNFKADRPNFKPDQPYFKLEKPYLKLKSNHAKLLLKDNRDDLPIACRNGPTCNWRPNCRYQHSPKQGQDKTMAIEAKEKQQAILTTKGDDGLIVKEENTKQCYQDGKCTGEHLAVRTKNPGGYWFEGGMKRCLPDGRGVMEYEEGLYQGEWMRGERHGLGRAEYWNEDEYVSHYLGDWEEGRYDGEGVTVLRNAKVYDGIFKTNCREGRGKLTMISGSSVEGEWSRCRLVGEGVVTIADEEADKVLGIGQIVLEGFEKEKWFTNCEETEVYDNFLENVVGDVSSMIFKGYEGPFVIAKQQSSYEEEKVGPKVSVAQVRKMLRNFKIVT